MGRALGRRGKREEGGRRAYGGLHSFTQGLNLRFVAGAPTQEERDLARELRAEEQATHAWSG